MELVQATVVENRLVAKDTFRMRLRVPTIAKAILPGQFVMVRLDGRTDPLLARPFALYDTYDDAGEIAGLDIVYLVLGNGTRALSHAGAADRCAVWGPLGQPFPLDLPADHAEHLVLVAGGIGQTPFPAVLNHYLGRRRYGLSPTSKQSSAPPRITVLYGVRSGAYFGGLDDLAPPGVDLQLATDDGSRGRRGFVTDLLADLIAGPHPPTAIFGCGPEPMLEKLSAIAGAAEIPTWVSLETKMACGYGVCFSCVAPLRPTGEPCGEWDYRRVCLEGPVFAAQRVVWHV